MLLLCFSMGGGRFAMDASDVLEVVPLVELEKVPGAPEYVAGIMRYHGRAVPVVDLCVLGVGRPAKELLSTRIILARYRADDGGERELGLVAERVTETILVDPKSFVLTGVSLKEADYLGKVVYDDEGMIQIVDVAGILPETARETFFPEREREA